MAADSTKCPIPTVDGFGPATRCDGFFDFTLLFEESILTIAPAILVVVIISVFYLKSLLGSTRKVSWTWHFRLKQISWTLLVLTNGVHLGHIASPTTAKTRTSIPAGAIVLSVHVIVGIVANLAHLRTVRPFSPVLLFLLSTLVFDVARCRTLWSVESGEQAAATLTVAVAFKAVLLVVESLEKRSILLPPYRALPHESTAGIFNEWFCWWMNPLLLFGYRHTHSLDTLYEVDHDLSVEGNAGLSELWASWKSKQSPHSLLLITLLHNKRVVGKAILPRLFQTGFTFAQPFLVRRVVNYIQQPNNSNNDAVGTGLIFSYVVVYVGSALATSLTQHWTVKLVARMRAGLIGLVYSRTLEIGSQAVDEADAITLMNADVQRITTGFQSFNELWACPVEIALSIWLLAGQLRVASLAPVVITIAFTGGAIAVASKAGITQKAWLDKIQLRVAVTASLLRVMSAVKMTGLTDNLKRKINSLRENEVDASFSFRVVLVKIVVLTFASTALTPVASFAMYILLQKYRQYAILDTANALTILALLQLLLAPVSILIDTLAGIMGAVGCFERIRNYLNSETRVDNRLHGPHQQTWTNYSSRLMRSLSSRRQSTAEPDWMYSPYSFDNPAGSPSLGEVYELGPTLRRRGAVTSRTRSSVEVHQASASWKEQAEPILKDLSFKIPDGKLTMVIGPVGSGKTTLLHTLLGETRSRGGSIHVTFEDAAYCSQRPWISNNTVRQNILSGYGFDPGWYSAVIHACCLTKDLEQLPQGDLTPVGSSGTGLSGGQQIRLTLARAIYSKKETIIMDDVLSGLDSTTEESVFASVFSRGGLLKKHNITVILATNAVHRLPDSDHIIVLDQGGTIAQQGSFRKLSLRAGYVSNLDLQKRQECVVQQKVQTVVEDKGQDVLSKALPEIHAPDAVTGDTRIYKYYIKSFGWVRWWILIAFCSFYGFGVVYPQAWVQRWAEHNMDHPGEKIAFYVGIHFMLGALTLLSLAASCGFLVISIAPRVAREMHSRVLNAIMDAPLSFFTQTDAGSITNRFSQDLDLIDMELPVSLIHTLLTGFILIAQTLVIAATARYAGAAIPVCVVAAYMTQKFYLRTSRVFRLLDIEAKSLLFSHFLETLSGLVTIRAFGWGEGYVRTNSYFVDLSQRPFYLLLSIQRWLGLVLDLLVSGIAVVLAVIAVKSKGDVNPGLMGLALLNIVGFSSVLKQLISNWTLLETSTGALSRVKSFTSSIASEHDASSAAHPTPDWHWPLEGAIEFNDVAASYTIPSSPVLNGVSFKISPGQRIGICGRSGSGKSSLLATLFRMTEITSGSIIIDGIDISTLPRNEVRLRLNALPQQPFCLPGTIRDNIDPTGQHDNNSIVAALYQVGLWDVFDNIPGGLDATMPANMLSHGQQQLLCLARAMMRSSSILVLDEATSSVDLETEALMQELIDKWFQHHTIIAVAHRLDTILNYDRVAVMDSGRLVEWDDPQELLQKDSIFRSLYLDMKGIRQDRDKDGSV